MFVPLLAMIVGFLWFIVNYLAGCPGLRGG